MASQPQRPAWMRFPTRAAAPVPVPFPDPPVAPPVASSAGIQPRGLFPFRLPTAAAPPPPVSVGPVRPVILPPALVAVAVAPTPAPPPAPVVDAVAMTPPSPPPVAAPAPQPSPTTRSPRVETVPPPMSPIQRPPSPRSSPPPTAMTPPPPLSPVTAPPPQLSPKRSPLQPPQPTPPSSPIRAPIPPPSPPATPPPPPKSPPLAAPPPPSPVQEPTLKDSQPLFSPPKPPSPTQTLKPERLGKIAVSPKPHNLSAPPSPLTLPPAIFRSNNNGVPEIEQKNVLLQPTIDKPMETPENHRNGDTSTGKRDKRPNNHKKTNSENPGVMLIMAGENKGAVMEFGSSSSPSRPKSHTLGNGSPNGEQSGEQMGKDDMGKKSISMAIPSPLTAFCNSNVQGLNNSIMYNCCFRSNDPGIRLSLKRSPNVRRESEE